MIKLQSSEMKNEEKQTPLYNTTRTRYLFWLQSFRSILFRDSVENNYFFLKIDNLFKPQIKPFSFFRW